MSFKTENIIKFNKRNPLNKLSKPTHTHTWRTHKYKNFHVHKPRNAVSHLCSNSKQTYKLRRYFFFKTRNIFLLNQLFLEVRVWQPSVLFPKCELFHLRNKPFESEMERTKNKVYNTLKVYEYLIGLEENFFFRTLPVFFPTCLGSRYIRIDKISKMFLVERILVYFIIMYKDYLFL